MKQVALLDALPDALAALAHAVGEHGASALERRVPHDVWRRALTGPAEEFLSRPGKQLRASLVRIGWLLAGGDPEAMPERLALVVELLHAGSLIIDDVEDGAVARRGAPALHHLVGAPLAINTGSWMYFWALAELAQAGLVPGAELSAYRAACTTLVRCHQGQALDLAVRIPDLALADVPAVVAATTRLKTGTLCAFATSLGAHALAAPPDVIEATAAFGTAAGTALQMLDDLGSLIAPARRDKGREDLRGLRPTWPWAWLAEARPFQWMRLTAQARAAGDDSELDALADTLAAEIADHGRWRIRALVDDALALAARAGNPPATALVHAALAQMENSYG